MADRDRAESQGLDARQADVIRRILQWQYDRKHTAAAVAPAEPVPVAMLGRTSTLELQDPYGSILRQITSVKDWLPDGFYIDGFYWDIESGGLDLEAARPQPDNWEPFVAKGLPRTGGLADLLSEARSPAPRFAAVVCEDIERSGRDTYNALKLERELGGSDILLFATDEPLDMEGTEPATILLRRTKQNMAEYFRLQLKQKMWRGHAHPRRAGLQPRQSPGRVPAGQDPAPGPGQSRRTAAPKPGWPWTRCAPPSSPPSSTCAPSKSSGVPTIHARLCADPDAYPPADPETGWTTGGIYSILANPKYTGHQVFGRVRKGKRVTPDKWYWSDQPTHPAIVDRDTWQTAQQVGAEHRSSRDGATCNPANWRTYPFRSRIRCKICKRRMCGLPKRHPDRKTPPSTSFTRASTTRTPPATSPPPPIIPAPSRSAKTCCRPRRCAGWPPTRWPPAASSASPSSSRLRPPRRRNSTTGRPPPCTSGSSASPARRTT